MSAVARHAAPSPWPADAEEFPGSGADITDKQELVGVPLLAGFVVFREGKYAPYVSVTCVTQDNREVVFNDGSTGVYRQIVDALHKAGRLDPSVSDPDSQEYEVRWVFKKGLRVSEYETTEGRPARTYYIA